MDRDLLKEKGFSLPEIAIALAVVSLILLALLPLGRQVIAQTKVTQIHHNLNAIGQAAREYYLRFGQWPQQASDLQPYFLTSDAQLQDYSLNPQDNILILSCGTDSVTVLKPYFSLAL